MTNKNISEKILEGDSLVTRKDFANAVQRYEDALRLLKKKFFSFTKSALALRSELHLKLALVMFTQNRDSENVMTHFRNALQLDSTINYSVVEKLARQLCIETNQNLVSAFKLAVFAFNLAEIQNVATRALAYRSSYVLGIQVVRNFSDQLEGSVSWSGSNVPPFPTIHTLSQGAGENGRFDLDCQIDRDAITNFRVPRYSRPLNLHHYLVEGEVMRSIDPFKNIIQKGFFSFQLCF